MGKSARLPEPIEVTIEVTRVLEKLGLPYFIGGSFANTLYGVVRTTQDSDIVADMRPEHIQPFITSFQDEFYMDEEMIAGAIRRNSRFNIIHRASMFKVDVFIPTQRPFLRSQLARAQEQTLSTDPEVSARFSSVEDTILAKLERYRLGGENSERQWRDVLGILKTRTGELDLDYLREWAKELKVSDLLEQVLENEFKACLSRRSLSPFFFLHSTHSFFVQMGYARDCLGYNRLGRSSAHDNHPSYRTRFPW